MGTQQHFLDRRSQLIDNPQSIIEVEEQFQEYLVHQVIGRCYEQIEKEFSDSPRELLDFWRNYPPEQRGRQPVGNSVPWLELGEKVIAHNIISQISRNNPHIQFHGLPTGGDIRFTLPGLYVHLDVKMTGPNDNPDEIVVPPNQISGAGDKWNRSGFLNSNFPIHYQSSTRSSLINYCFQPKLPPFYIIEGNCHLTITAFIDAIYDVQSFGNHKLLKLEVSIVPNGLLLFDTLMLANTNGLLIAGKDDKTIPDDSKRVRVRLNPLSTIAKWRSISVLKLGGDINFQFRR
jgi:hypothetical protein